MNWNIFVETTTEVMVGKSIFHLPNCSKLSSPDQGFYSPKDWCGSEQFSVFGRSIPERIKSSGHVINTLIQRFH